MNKPGAPANPGLQQGGQGHPKSAAFDPISSLTQMSNLLTNSVASSINGQPPPGVFLPGGRNSGFINNQHAMHGMGNEMSQQQQHHMQQQQAQQHHMQQQQECSIPGISGNAMECGPMGGMNAGQFPGPMHNQMNPHGAGGMPGRKIYTYF